MRLAVVFATFFFLLPSAWARPVVVATHTILADLTQQVAGQSFEVRCLVSSDVDPHGYEPSAADLRLLRGAQLVVQNGLGFDLWAKPLLTESGFTGRTLVAGSHLPYPLKLADAHDHDHHDHAEGHEHGETDPHFWHDPRNVAAVARAIAEELVRLAPAEGEAIRSRLAAFEQRLDQLHQRALRELSQIPAENRVFAATHDALAYLGNAYNFRIVSIAGTRPDQEPSARELAGIVKRMRREHIRVVFVESTANNKLADTLSRESGARVVAGLHTDVLGPQGSSAETYLGMLEENIGTLLQALR